MLMQAANGAGAQEQVEFLINKHFEIRVFSNIYIYYTYGKFKIDLLCCLQVLVRKIIELHDKFMAYVNDCFLNHTLFHKVRVRDTSIVSFHFPCIILAELCFFCCQNRPWKRLLRCSAIKLLLARLVQNCLRLFVIISSRRVGVRSWVMRL